MSQAQPEPQRRNSTGKHLAKFAGIIAAVIIVASISYTLGSFNARDTVSRPAGRLTVSRALKLPSV